MQTESLFSFIKHLFVKKDICEDTVQAGTGFMQSLTEGIHKLQGKGYTANLVPKYDHLECEMGKFKLYPQDLIIDKVYRFENTSDPDDQSILYAISAPSKAIKGLYVESYGTYHDELSRSMIERLKLHPH